MQRTLAAGETTDKLVVPAGARVTASASVYWAESLSAAWKPWPGGDYCDALRPMVIYAVGPGILTIEEGRGLEHDESFYWATSGSADTEPTVQTPLDPSECEALRLLLMAGFFGEALIVDTVAPSIAIPTAPAPMVWENVRKPAHKYTPATGVFHFEKDTFFISVANWTIVGAASKRFYADAESSTDGINWTRGTNSLRIGASSADGNTMSFAFAGHFAAGVYLRFVYWASATGVTMNTENINGSTSAASRLTVAMMHGKLES